VYDKTTSTLAASSATGGSYNSIDYFQYINADKFITQGGTSSQFVKGDGSLDSNVVISFNGLTGAVGFSNYVSSVNGATGAIVSVAVTGSNTFTGLQTMTAGITASNLYVSTGATFASLATFSSGLSSGSTITVNNAIQVAQPAANTTALVLRTRATNSNFITINATGGNVTVAPGTGVLRVTQGYGSSGTITNSSRGYLTLQGTDGDASSWDVTIDPSTTLSASRTLTCPNLSGTLAVVNAAQTFSSLQSFTAGITSNNLWVTNGATFAGSGVFTGLATFNGGITANNLWVTNGATFASNISAPNIVNSFNGATGSVLADAVTWSVIAVDTTAVVNRGYFTNKSTRLIVTLPDTAAVGSVLRVSGMTAGGWRIAQNASEVIHFGKTDTTTGTGGYIESTLARDSVELICCVADNEWNVVSSIGNITIV